MIPLQAAAPSPLEGLEVVLFAIMILTFITGAHLLSGWLMSFLTGWRGLAKTFAAPAVVSGIEYPRVRGRAGFTWTMTKMVVLMSARGRRFRFSFPAYPSLGPETEKNGGTKGA